MRILAAVLCMALPVSAQVEFATTIEFPYANANSKEVNAKSSRAIGADLARAIRVYLENEP